MNEARYILERVKVLGKERYFWKKEIDPEDEISMFRHRGWEMTRNLMNEFDRGTVYETKDIYFLINIFRTLEKRKEF